MREEVRPWRIHLRTATDLEELATWINPVVRGWMTSYGKFYRTALYRLMQPINTYLVRWATREFKRLRSFEGAQGDGTGCRAAARPVRSLAMVTSFQNDLWMRRAE